MKKSNGQMLAINEVLISFSLFSDRNNVKFCVGSEFICS